jgi:hypothetical protein
MLLKTKEEQHVISSGECAVPPMMNSRNPHVFTRREPETPSVAQKQTPGTETHNIVSKQSSVPNRESVIIAPPLMNSDSIRRTRFGREVKKPKYLENYSDK